MKEEKHIGRIVVYDTDGAVIYDDKPNIVCYLAVKENEKINVCGGMSTTTEVSAEALKRTLENLDEIVKKVSIATILKLLKETDENGDKK